MRLLHLADEFPKSIDSRAKFIDFRRIHEFDTEFVKIVSHRCEQILTADVLKSMNS